VKERSGDLVSKEKKALGENLDPKSVKEKTSD
jgi:hypothetical protein